MQSKPIRNVDFDANTAKHVTFYNENFKRGRCDLLKKIQRSTRSGGAAGGHDQSKEVQQLKDKVSELEDTIEDLRTQSEERIRRLELDMLGRMEQMMLAMQQQQQQQQQNPLLHLQSQTMSASVADRMTSSGTFNGMSNNNNGNNIGMNGNSFDPLPYGNRGTSIGSLSGIASLMGGHQASIGLKNGLQGFGTPAVPMGGNGGGPTLPPHPKQKQLPTGPLPGSLGLPPSRMDSLRGISTLSRGISNLSRGLSTESQGSAILGNAFEDKFFSMLMNGEKQGSGNNTTNNFLNPTPINMANIQQQQQLQQQLQG
jgi:TolA-binding protein